LRRLLASIVDVPRPTRFAPVAVTALDAPAALVDAGGTSTGT
jgi:hypothetical protein